MIFKNYVFVGSSLDGYIADSAGGLDWLNIIPNPENSDMGYTAFTNKIDAIVMGRTTFEVVCGFGGDWPYNKPVFVLSNSLKAIPDQFAEKAHLVNGPLTEVLDTIHEQGYANLYIDGGATVQNFLKEDLIDELIISTIPVLLGGGISLFGDLPSKMEFEHVKSELFLNAITQDSYRRKH